VLHLLYRHINLLNISVEVVLRLSAHKFIPSQTGNLVNTGCQDSCKCAKKHTKITSFFMVWFIHAHSTALNHLLGITSVFTEILLNRTNKAIYEAGIITNMKNCKFTPKCMCVDKFEYHIQ